MSSKAKKAQTASRRASPKKKSPAAKKPSTAAKKSSAAPAKKRSPAPRRSKKADQDELMGKLKRYVRAHAEGFLRDPNITSVGIGYKHTAGQKTPELAVQFSVKSKVVPEELPGLGTQLIPPTLNVEGESVPTDVVERSFEPSYTTTEPKPKDERRGRAPVLRPGMSIGSVATLGGTLGTFVLDPKSKQVLILSNWHVLQGSKGQLGDDVVQPAKHDDNRVEENNVGKLVRSHLGPAGDCAIASVSGRGISNDIIELEVSCAKIGDPHLGDSVVKSGRTTAVTYGVVTRLEVSTKMVYPGGAEATVGGFEIGPDPKNPASENEISRGGDSGSAWMAVDKRGKATDIMLGLHFAGDSDQGGVAEFALACYAASVLTKLEVEPLGKIEQRPVAPEGLEDELRQGFDSSFLPFPVGAPKFSNVRRADLAELDGDREIRYCHFSVWLSKKRRYPACVAWNIDGNAFKRLNRVSFRTDRRGDLEEYQLTNDIYAQNVLDKGHIARRADLSWGTLEEAKQGNYDSFFYTNIAPQHQAFNQSKDRTADPEGGIWGRLENTIFDSENPHELKVSLLAGPVISAKDRKFIQNDEECFLPREYWKVVAYVDDRDNKEKVFGFLLTQASLIEGLVVPEGIDFDAWLWARITLQDLREKTGITFPKAVRDREVPFVAPQALGATLSVRPIFLAQDYFAS
jgi:endonuclease G, mitochondrial